MLFRSECSTCIGKTNKDCLSCSNSSEYMLNYECVPSCPKDYVSISRICYSIFYLNYLECHSSCATCFDISREGCTSCEVGKYLWESMCLSFCPSGTFINGNICQNCNSSCSTCTSLYECTICQKKYYLKDSVCVSDKDCSSGEYPDKIKKKCQGCSIACKECYGGTDRKSVV